MKRMSDFTKYMVLSALVLLIFLMLALYVNNIMSEEENYRGAYLSYQEGRLDSYDKAWSQGRDQGKLESEYLADYYGLFNQAESFNEGWQQGYNDGQYRYGYGR